MIISRTPYRISYFGGGMITIRGTKNMEQQFFLAQSSSLLLTMPYPPTFF